MSEVFVVIEMKPPEVQTDAHEFLRFDYTLKFQEPKIHGVFKSVEGADNCIKNNGLSLKYVRKWVFEVEP